MTVLSYSTVQYSTVVLCGTVVGSVVRSYEYFLSLAQSYEQTLVVQCVRNIPQIPSDINSQAVHPRLLPILMNKIGETSKSWPVLQLADHGMKHAATKDIHNKDNHLIM